MVSAALFKITAQPKGPTVGAAVDPQGDIQNIFNNGGGTASASFLQRVDPLLKTLVANAKFHDQPIKLLRVFDEHKMFAALCFFEHFEL
jgi:hypothetical protein